jgi:hypothetical protein
MKGSLHCCINSLSVKHVDAPKSSNTLIFIILDLLHFIMINNKETRC